MNELDKIAKEFKSALINSTTLRISRIDEVVGIAKEFEMGGSELNSLIKSWKKQIKQIKKYDKNMLDSPVIKYI